MRSIHAYFPSVVAFDENHLGASVVLGEAFEAPNLHLAYLESRDGGASWNRRSTITEPSEDFSSSTVGRISLLADGSLSAIVSRHERRPFDSGLTGGDSIGMLPMRIEQHRSTDQGVSWTGPQLVEPPISDTAFEMCAGFTALADHSLLWPTSTWPYSGQKVSAEGFRTGAFRSRDGGKTWPEWIETFPNDDRIYWEAKIIVLPDQRLLSVAWVHDLAAGRDLPNHFVIGSPDGREWSRPQSMDILGQTLSSVVLPEGRILSVYRRMDEPGLWATISRLSGTTWTNEEAHPLWRGDMRRSEGEGIREQFAALKFGAPSVVRIAESKILVAFWCVVDGVSQVTAIPLDC
ncbi:MAG TPA: sialidase family protein [Terrimicrobiaceae bacterium]|nr:sialidase family protein [Terrimicrobiaceae bacterium]